jgi:phage anti-repressor protein
VKRIWIGIREDVKVMDLIIRRFQFSYITRNGLGRNDKEGYALTIDTKSMLQMIKEQKREKAGKRYLLNVKRQS